jgi:A/G-specific adenine glycosylase
MNTQKRNTGNRHPDMRAREMSAEDFYSRIKNKGVTHAEIRKFRGVIYRYYREHARGSLPWRNTDDPYHILVSEIMLQQTQIERVLHKYPLLIKKYPDLASLSRARLRSLYAVWQGMGYNRRALALRNIARSVAAPPYNGRLPSEMSDLMRLPFVGQSTAGAVAAFAFHKPVAFIETNIRRVFIHFFFRAEKQVKDSDILPLVERTIDKKDPRNWYYALMDYGSMLGSLIKNPNRKSTHYRKQPAFAGSNRQLRGQILRALSIHPTISCRDLGHQLNIPYRKILEMTAQLQKEGFINKSGNLFRMA